MSLPPPPVSCSIRPLFRQPNPDTYFSPGSAFSTWHIWACSSSSDTFLGIRGRPWRGATWGWVVETIADPPSPPSHYPSIQRPGGSPSSGRNYSLPALLGSRGLPPSRPASRPDGDDGRSQGKLVSFPPSFPSFSSPLHPQTPNLQSSPCWPLSAAASDLQMHSLLSVLLTPGWQCRPARLPRGQLRPALLLLKSPHVLKLIKTNTAHIFVLNPILHWAGVGEGG